jgi:hypothetical protein
MELDFYWCIREVQHVYCVEFCIGAFLTVRLY